MSGPIKPLPYKEFTFEADISVRIFLGVAEIRKRITFIIINNVAIFVDSWWIAVDDVSRISIILNILTEVSSLPAFLKKTSTI